MAIPVSFFGQTLLDYSNEKSTHRFAITTLTAANLVAQQSLMTDLGLAIAAITLCNIAKNLTIVSDSNTAASVPSDPDAQREKKWLVRYHGNTTNKKFTSEIGGADLSLLATAPQSDFMDTAATEYTDFKAAFEAIVKSPDNDGETTVVDSLEYVGRRL